MHLSTPMIIAGAGFALTLFAAFMFHLARQRRRTARDAIRDLGFVPHTPSAEVTSRITGLYDQLRPSSSPYSLREVYTQRKQGADLYLFDLIEESSDGDYTDQHAIAVVSARLHAPVFIVLPRVDSEGALSRIANKVMKSMARSFGEAVEFPNETEFNHHCMVNSREPDETRRFLRGDRLRCLARIGFHSVRAGGDVLVVSRNIGSTRPFNRDRLREHMDHAMNVLAAFSD